LKSMNLYSEELNFAPWKHIALHNFVADLIMERSRTGVFVIAIDGRSGGGKSTMASVLAGFLPDALVIHTDDIAWHHSFFDWQDVLIEHVLKPLSAHGAVSYQPEAWKHHGREGAIEVPSTSKFVILEGVGAGRRELGRYINKLIWVQSDYIQARLQGIARDGGGTKVEAFWDEWLASERPFLAHQQPWLRADKVVLGVAEQPQLSPPEFIKVSGKV
ncbi:MAG: hypothetical protein AAF708_14795, partial [Deinococcota bacterium]